MCEVWEQVSVILNVPTEAKHSIARRISQIIRTKQLLNTHENIRNIAKLINDMQISLQRAEKELLLSMDMIPINIKVIKCNIVISS